MSNNSILDVLLQLKPYIDDLSRGYLETDSKYTSTLKSALVKSFEFNLFVWQAQEDKNSFFSTATLRGICEDIITLNFINTLSDEHKNQIIDKFLFLDVLKSSEIQSVFFQSNRPLQPIYTKKDKSKLELQISQLEEDIKNIAKNYRDWNPSRYKLLPSVKNMAKLCNLEELYDYLYAATSRWVHFNTSILLRMVWYEEGKPDSPYQTSTENFCTYYLDFNRFYASYLLIKFYDIFNNDLHFPKDSSSLFEEMRIFNQKTLRWPELITFEEMNIEPPPIFYYNLSNIFGSTHK